MTKSSIGLWFSLGIEYSIRHSERLVHSFCRTTTFQMYRPSPRIPGCGCCHGGIAQDCQGIGKIIWCCKFHINLVFGYNVSSFRNCLYLSWFLSGTYLQHPNWLIGCWRKGMWGWKCHHHHPLPPPPIPAQIETVIPRLIAEALITWKYMLIDQLKR